MMFPGYLWQHCAEKIILLYYIIERKEVPMKIFGIDTSKYQGTIDWAKAKAGGVKFAMLKAVSTNRTGLYIDPFFEKNYAECKRLGIPVGVYYYTYAKDKVYADKELALLKKAITGKKFEFPVVVDVEDNLLKPLSKLHFPAHELAMMMTIALRFIPTLIEEADKIMKAQMARGADFESGNLIKRAKAMVPLLVPLFVSAFRRAGELAMAMEARCYHGGEGRTRLRVLHFQKIDWQASLVTVAALLVTILCRRWNLL